MTPATLFRKCSLKLEDNLSGEGLVQINTGHIYTPSQYKCIKKILKACDFRRTYKYVDAYTIKEDWRCGDKTVNIERERQLYL